MSSSPKTTPDGELIVASYDRGQFFKSGYVSAKCGRSIVTWKEYHIDGFIPDTGYRAPRNKAGLAARLYTLHQLEVLVGAFRLIDSGKLKRAQLRAYLDKRWIPKQKEKTYVPETGEILLREGND